MAVPAITAVRATPRRSPGMAVPLFLVLSDVGRRRRRPRGPPASPGRGCDHSPRAVRHRAAPRRRRGRPRRSRRRGCLAELPGSRSLPASSMSSSPSSPDDAPSNAARSSSPSPSKSEIAIPLTVPSRSLVTKARSRMRMMPRSTRSTRMREALPRHLAAGELHHDVVDRTHLVDFCAADLVKVVGHALLLEDSDGGSGTPPRSDPRQAGRRVASPVADEEERRRAGQGLMSEPWTVSARMTTMSSAIIISDQSG